MSDFALEVVKYPKVTPK